MKFNVTSIVGLITQVPALIQGVSDVVDSVKHVMSSDDLAEVDNALIEIQKQNDLAYQALRQKLQQIANSTPPAPS